MFVLIRLSVWQRVFLCVSVQWCVCACVLLTPFDMTTSQQKPNTHELTYRARD